MILATRAALRALTNLLTSPEIPDRDTPRDLLSVFRVLSVAMAYSKFDLPHEPLRTAVDRAFKPLPTIKFLDPVLPGYLSVREAGKTMAVALDRVPGELGFESHAANAVQASMLANSNALIGFESDVTEIARGVSAAELSRLPIWLDGDSMDANAVWEFVVSHIQTRGDNWSVWGNWLRAVFVGSPIDPELGEEANRRIEQAYVMIEEADWDQGPTFVNLLIKKKIEEIKGEYSTAGASTQPTISMKEFIIGLLDSEDRPLSISEISDSFAEAGYSSPRHSIRGRLNELTYQRRISRVAKGVYALAKKRSYPDRELDGVYGGLEHPDPESYQIPEIPAQGFGLAFEISKNGKIGFANTGLVTQDDEITQVGALRDVILPVLDDLLRVTAGSNAFSSVERIARQYRSVLDQEINVLSVDRLYALGIRFEHASVRLRKEIVKGDLPDVGLDIGEAIDSVIAIHGPMILSTRRGQELLNRSRQYNFGREEDLAYKERATAFAMALSDSDDLVDSEVKEVVEALNSEISEGRFPERIGDVARSTNRNLIVTIVLSVVSSGFLASHLGATLAGVTTELINAATTFLLAHDHNLRMLAAVAGQELSWLTAFLDWWRQQRNR